MKFLSRITLEILACAGIVAVVFLLFFPTELPKHKPVLNQSMAYPVKVADRCAGFPHILCEKGE